MAFPHLNQTDNEKRPLAKGTTSLPFSGLRGAGDRTRTGDILLLRRLCGESGPVAVRCSIRSA
jgi:hypothetical protein